MEDNEKTYAQLYERVQKTIDALKTAKAENFEGKEGSEVTIKLPQRELKFTGITYLQKFGELARRLLFSMEVGEVCGSAVADYWSQACRIFSSMLLRLMIF